MNAREEILGRIRTALGETGSLQYIDELRHGQSVLDRDKDFFIARLGFPVQSRQNGLLPSKSACDLLMPISFSIWSLSASRAQRWRATC